MTPSFTVNIAPPTPDTCPIWIEDGLLNTLTTCLSMLPNYTAIENWVIITDDNVKPLYGEHLLRKLKILDLNAILIDFPAGEHAKTRSTQQMIEEEMFRHGCHRQTMILALGGGVVGDLAGFIAATYMRGIPYIQVPTSLLAMVDSSVGGKTAIDTAFGKNLIGAFWQPKAVIADISCLSTLPSHHLTNGFVEALKVFLTHDAQYFQYASQHIHQLLERDMAFLKRMITQAVRIKAKIIEADEKEQHERATLNFGHTIGHALEKLTQYELLHGFAVGLGMLVEAKISEILGILSLHSYYQIQSTLAKIGIQAKQLQLFDIEAIIQATRLDKKNKGGKVRYPLLSDLGKVYQERNIFTHPVDDDVIKAALSSLGLI